jgi:3-hydroxypropanoate dehydrogenase
MGSVAHLIPPVPQAGGSGLHRVLYAARRRLRWAPLPIPRDRLDELHALLSLGPSLVDASPVQVLFLASGSAKDRLLQHLPAAAQADAMAAPAYAVIGYDVDFAEQLVEFLPHTAPGPSSLDRPEVVRQTAIRHGGLQGAYLIVAARALGLEAVAIPDFDAAGVSFEFFRGARVRATFLCGLGYPEVRRRAGRSETV